MTPISIEVTGFLESMGIPSSEQNPEYRLEIAYRIGYADALRNYATWKNGEQLVGALQRPLKEVLAAFKNTDIPERY